MNGPSSLTGFLASQHGWDGGMSPNRWRATEAEARRLSRGHNGSGATKVGVFNGRWNGNQQLFQQSNIQQQEQEVSNQMDTHSNETEHQELLNDNVVLPQRNQTSINYNNNAQINSNNSVYTAGVQNSQEQSKMRKNKRDVTRTVIVTKVKSELLGKELEMVAKLIELGIKESTIGTISFTSASSCLIKFNKPEEAENSLKLQIDLISNKGNISKLTFTNPNNFVLLHGTSTEELEKKNGETGTKSFRSGEASGNLEAVGILNIEALRSNYKDRSTGIVKAYCKDDTAMQNLLSHGLIFNYLKHNVSKFVKRQNETVCYNCAGFNHMAIHCKKPAKCYKCSEGHAGYNCPIKKVAPENQKTMYKCPACGGDHPLTYGNCPKRKERELGTLTKVKHREEPWYRNQSTFSQPQRPQANVRAGEGVTDISAIMKKLCSMEESLKSRLDRIEGAVKKLEVEVKESMDQINENTNRVDGLVATTNTLDAKIDHLFGFIIRQLYNLNKGLQTEKSFLSLAQKYFNADLGFVHEDISSRNTKSSTHTASNYHG